MKAWKIASRGSILALVLIAACSGPVRPAPPDADASMDADGVADATPEADMNGEADVDSDGEADGEIDADDEIDADADVTMPACGNGVTEPGEACDDGNEVAWDGCTDCAITEFLVADDPEWLVMPGDVAILEGGGFVAVWALDRGLIGGVYARLYGDDGRPLGDPLTLFTDEERIVQNNPAVAATDDGGFVAVWNGWDSDHRGIWVRAFDGDGVAAAPETLVNDFEPGEQEAPALASSDEGFVVVWQGGTEADPAGIAGRLLDVAGVPTGSSFQINSTLGDLQQIPAVAAAPDGHSTTIWWSARQDPDGSHGVYGRRLEPSGEAGGDEFRAHTAIDGTQGGPSIAMAHDGSFVAVWHTYRSSDETDGIYGRRYGADGTPEGEPFRVDPPEFRPGNTPRIAMAPDGRFVVVWTNYFELGSDEEVFAQLFDASAEPTGEPLLINTFTTGRQTYPAVSMAPDGSFVVVWSSTGQVGEDPALFAQRLSPEGAPLGRTRR